MDKRIACYTTQTRNCYRNKKKTPFVFVFNDQVVARVVAHYCIRAQTNFVLFCLPISLGVGVIVITLQWFNQYYCVDINLQLHTAMKSSCYVSALWNVEQQRMWDES